MALGCIHTHTVFCDGLDDIETYCRVAYEKGLACIGFSAHAPVTSKAGITTSWNLPDEKLPEYLDSVLDAKIRWEGKIPVYLGLEVDFIEGLMGPADADYREMDLDFIIGSIHYVIPPNGMLFTVDDTPESVYAGISKGFDGDPMGMVEAYYHSVASMILAGGFDVLGHADLVRKNNAGDSLFPEDDDLYLEQIILIPGLMAEAGVPAELNTGGMNRSNTKDCYPSLDLLTLFRENGVPIVINADAHKVEELDGHYDEARKAMLDAGYTESLIFKGRKDGKALWESEKL